jgi:hypothetical protein
MGNTMRVALQSYNAETDTDPRHYSLFTDEDNVLIKEHSRGSAEKDAGQTLTVNHDLGYYPHFCAYAEISSGRYQVVNGYNLFGAYRSNVDVDNLYIKNVLAGNDFTMRYFIFYDDIPE